MQNSGRSACILTLLFVLERGRGGGYCTVLYCTDEEGGRAGGEGEYYRQRWRESCLRRWGCSPNPLSRLFRAFPGMLYRSTHGAISTRTPPTAHDTHLNADPIAAHFHIRVDWIWTGPASHASERAPPYSISAEDRALAALGHIRNLYET